MDDELGSTRKLIVKLEVLAELEETPGVTHGLVSRYNKGCRGPLCREAVRLARNARRTYIHPTIVEYLAELTADHQAERTDAWQHQVRGA